MEPRQGEKGVTLINLQEVELQPFNNIKAYSSNRSSISSLGSGYMGQNLTSGHLGDSFTRSLAAGLANKGRVGPGRAVFRDAKTQTYDHRTKWASKGRGHCIIATSEEDEGDSQAPHTTSSRPKTQPQSCWSSSNSWNPCCQNQSGEEQARQGQGQGCWKTWLKMIIILIIRVINVILMAEMFSAMPMAQATNDLPFLLLNRPHIKLFLTKSGKWQIVWITYMWQFL